MSKDLFGLGNSPEREKYRRELDAETKRTIHKTANAGMDDQIARLEKLRAVDPSPVELAKLAQENLDALGEDERFLHVMQDRNHPDHESTMRLYRQLCEDACAHESSDPKEAALQRLMRGGRLKTPKALGDPGY